MIHSVFLTFFLSILAGRGQESDAVEELEDDEFEEAQEDEAAWGESNDQEGFQDEEEEQSYQPSMAW